MKMNARTFNRKTTVSHTAYEGTRIRAGVRAGAVRATVTAKHTIVSPPERPIASARIQTPNVVTNCRITAVGTSRIRAVHLRVSHPSAGPTTRLPATANRNVGATDPIEKLLAATAPTARR